MPVQLLLLVPYGAQLLGITLIHFFQLQLITLTLLEQYQLMIIVQQEEKLIMLLLSKVIGDLAATLLQLSMFNII